MGKKRRELEDENEIAFLPFHVFFYHGLVFFLVWFTSNASKEKNM